MLILFVGPHDMYELAAQYRIYNLVDHIRIRNIAIGNVISSIDSIQFWHT